MAATGPERNLLAASILIVLCCAPARADRDADLRDRISAVATALSSGNASDAMSPFDKSFANYDKLSSYFQALSTYRVANQVNVTDQDDNGTETNLSVEWTLNLSDPNTRDSDSRTETLAIRLALKGGKWKIVDLAPVDFFNPLRKGAPGKRQP